MYILSFKVINMIKVFTDGSAGTTGLRIKERLAVRNDVEIISLPEELRKNINARKEALNKADVAFLCLPDAASIESVSLVENPATKIIDTSTAHRVNPQWAYGFPELTGYREKIRKSVIPSLKNYITNPLPSKRRQRQQRKRRRKANEVLVGPCEP